MPTNGPNGIQIQIGGDATPLERDIAAAKAKVEAESSTTKVGAGSSKAAAEVEAIGNNAEKAAASLNRMGQTATNAVGQNSNTASGLKALNKHLSDTVGQVQGLVGKLTMVVGTATGFFALGRAIRESVIAALETGTEKAERFAESLDLSKKADSIKSISDEINKLSGELTAQETNPLDRAVGFFTGTNPEKLKEEITRLNKLAASLRENEQAERRRKEREEEERQRQEELKKNTEAVLKDSANRQAEFAKQMEKRAEMMEEFRRKQAEMLEDMQIREEQAARRTQQAWETSLRAIREASNAAFNTDNARSMVELAGNLNATATTATANMNRIIVGGTD